VYIGERAGNVRIKAVACWRTCAKDSVAVSDGCGIGVARYLWVLLDPLKDAMFRTVTMGVSCGDLMDALGNWQPQRLRREHERQDRHQRRCKG